MPRKLKDSVVVITGASSGIGKATALRFASKGATLALGARREGPLQDVVQACERNGGRAIAVQVDVTKEDQVQNLARQAIENFGRIDVWVNNAGVMLFGSFEESPPEVFRQVFETNLFGNVNGARAVLPYFREQGNGVLINMSSVYGAAGAPYLTAYVSSKFAVRGFSESLRLELEDEDNIHVCTVLPASIDTPLFQHAANYSGRQVRPVPPIYDAELVAKRIVELAENPQPEAIAGTAGKALHAQRRLAPRLTSRLINRLARRGHFEEESAQPTPGNVLEPVAFGTGISGGWKDTEETPKKRRFVLFGAAAAVPAFLALRKASTEDERGRSRRMKAGKRARAKVQQAGKARVATLKPISKSASDTVRARLPI